jgi:D-allose transport system substrate-binding protein
MAASVAQLPYLMGQRAVELSLEALSGRVHERTEYIPTPLLTKEMLKANTDPILQYVK